MAGGRPLKLTPEVSATICARLQAGCTRKAAAESANVSYDSFLGWLKKGAEATSGQFFEFFGAVTRAEAEAEVRHTAVLMKAATGFNSVQTTRTVKSVEAMRKTRHPDGTVVEEPFVLELVTETTVGESQFDWRAAESWLKRRRKDEWGDKVAQDITSNGETLAPNIEIALVKVYGDAGGAEQ